MNSTRHIGRAVAGLIAATAMMFVGVPASYAADNTGLNNSIETATTVAPNTKVSGVSGLTPRYYKVTLPSAGYVQLKMTNSQGLSAAKWNVQIQDATAKTIAAEVWTPMCSPMRAAEWVSLPATTT